MSTTVQPGISEVQAYARSLPEIYRSLLLGFREACPDRKYKEAILESTLRNYVKNSSYQLRTVGGVTDEQIDEAIRQLAYHEFVVRHQLMPENSIRADVNQFVWSLYGAKFLIAPTELGEQILEAITGSPTPKPIVPQLPIPTWMTNK